MRERLTSFLRGLGNLVVVCGLGIGVQVLLQRPLPGAAAALLATVVLLVAYVAGARWIEGRRAVELRAADCVRGIGTGLVLGIVLFSSVMTVLWLAGVYRPAGWGHWQPLALALLSALAGAVFEEVIFRGFLFRLVAGLGGNWTALGATSALFGLAHISNPGATWASSLAVAIEAGILLGAAYAASGSLWLPIGIHAGWNFTEGPVFGMEVSGHAGAGGWIGGQLQGPAILTGGAFGPEASILAVVVCLVLATFYLRRMVLRRPVELT
ncbi:MAG: CPBP family intramembrane glutamic endopeptidase [Bryobacteraceae bacterium]